MAAVRESASCLSHEEFVNRFADSADPLVRAACRRLADLLDDREEECGFHRDEVEDLQADLTEERCKTSQLRDQLVVVARFIEDLPTSSKKIEARAASILGEIDSTLRNNA